MKSNHQNLALISSLLSLTLFFAEPTHAQLTKQCRSILEKVACEAGAKRSRRTIRVADGKARAIDCVNGDVTKSYICAPTYDYQMPGITLIMIVDNKSTKEHSYSAHYPTLDTRHNFAHLPQLYFSEQSIGLHTVKSDSYYKSGKIKRTARYNPDDTDDWKEFNEDGNVTKSGKSIKVDAKTEAMIWWDFLKNEVIQTSCTAKVEKNDLEKMGVLPRESINADIGTFRHEYFTFYLKDSKDEYLEASFISDSKAFLPDDVSVATLLIQEANYPSEYTKIKELKDTITYDNIAEVCLKIKETVQQIPILKK